MKKISIFVKGRQMEVLDVQGQCVLVPRVENGVCLLDENQQPVLRWVDVGRPIELGRFTRGNILGLATLAFLSYSVVVLLIKALF